MFAGPGLKSLWPVCVVHAVDESARSVTQVEFFFQALGIGAILKADSISLHIVEGFRRRHQD